MIYPGNYTIIKFGMTNNAHFYKTCGNSCFSKHIRSSPLNEGSYEDIRLTPTNTLNLYVSTPPDAYNAKGVTYMEGYGNVNNYNYIFEHMNLYCTSLIIDGNDSLGGTNALTMSLKTLLHKIRQTGYTPTLQNMILRLLCRMKFSTRGVYF